MQVKRLHSCRSCPTDMLFMDFKNNKHSLELLKSQAGNATSAYFRMNI
jgi:hypothetical protein